jgi:oligoribonuclease
MNQPSLVWLDLEMTDLDPVLGRIVEIATVITDAKLHIIAKGPDLVIHESPEILSKMVNWNQEHFHESGLMDEITSSKITLREAEQAILKFISQYFEPQKAILAGNSVYVDREFVSVHMPELSSYLHYRIIDVNTIRELAIRWFPNLPKFPKNEKHRAMSDNLESIDELKYYQVNMFRDLHEN